MSLPITETNSKKFLTEVDAAGGFGFAVTRAVNPSIFQRLIEFFTGSVWGHCVMVIGEDIGQEARRIKPSILHKKQSHRWTNRSPGHPVPLIEGIRHAPLKHETVDSNALVQVSDLSKWIEAGEQIVFFANPDWTLTQKLVMAIEAYSWVGEPYDVFEIGNWLTRLIPNPSRLKVCSSLIYQIIVTGDLKIMNWTHSKKINGEKFAPRDVFDYGSDHSDFIKCCFRCRFEDALKC